MAQEMNIAPGPAQSQEIRLGHITYALYALSLPIIGVIIAYIKKSEVQGILKNHFLYLIKTFWLSMLGSLVLTIPLIVVSASFFVDSVDISLTSFVVVYTAELVILIVLIIWYIYRIVKGWLRYNDGMDIKNPTGWF